MSIDMRNQSIVTRLCLFPWARVQLDLYQQQQGNATSIFVVNLAWHMLTKWVCAVLMACSETFIRRIAAPWALMSDVGKRPVLKLCDVLKGVPPLTAGSGCGGLQADVVGVRLRRLFLYTISGRALDIAQLAPGWWEFISNEGFKQGLFVCSRVLVEATSSPRCSQTSRLGHDSRCLDISAPWPQATP